MSEKGFLENNNRKQDIQRQEFMDTKIINDFIVRDPYTGEPWVYDEEITKIFEDISTNSTTNLLNK